MKKFLAISALLAGALTSGAFAQTGGELRFVLHSEPKTFNPLLMEDDSSESIRYMTGGVLIRVNRLTQEATPELATSWKISNGGRTISFELRSGLRFSDGTPFSANDVSFTMKQLMDPALHSPTGDMFRSGDGQVQVKADSPTHVTITFSAPLADMVKSFDQVAIMSATSPQKEMAVLGPFFVAENKAGSYLLLKRNPYYWKHDAQGRQLPYFDSVRLDIIQNQDTEILRLLRGEIDFINTLSPDYYDKIEEQKPALVHDAGVSLDSEFMWFNQVPSAPIPDYKKEWFRSTSFRRAISEAINRQAQPAVGSVSTANKFWFNARLHPHPFDQKSALKRLNDDGFTFQNGTLRDREGHLVEFSIITNTNKNRERMATLIQQDLSDIGIKLNVVTLDFPSLIDRMTHTYDYEACLLGFVNDELDPNSEMNVWVSSSENHQWNPKQKTPATPWEAQIDKLMREQASTLDDNQRKKYYDQVQQIV